MKTFAETVGSHRGRSVRVHDSCYDGSTFYHEVRPEDPEEPKWWCSYCQTSVHSEDTTLFPASREPNLGPLGDVVQRLREALKNLRDVETGCFCRPIRGMHDPACKDAMMILAETETEVLLKEVEDHDG